MKIKEVKVYTFEELPEASKKKALETYRNNQWVKIRYIGYPERTAKKKFREHLKQLKITSHV